MPWIVLRHRFRHFMKKVLLDLRRQTVARPEPCKLAREADAFPQVFPRARDAALRTRKLQLAPMPRFVQADVKMSHHVGKIRFCYGGGVFLIRIHPLPSIRQIVAEAQHDAVDEQSQRVFRFVNRDSHHCHVVQRPPSIIGRTPSGNRFLAAVRR